MTDYDKKRIKELCEKASVRKPYIYSSWIFMRAAGVSKEAAAPMIGISSRQLSRYEERVKDYLSEEERFELIKHSFLSEYEDRMLNRGEAA